MPENATETGFGPPYIAFRTVMDIIKRMAEEEPPARIDKSYLNNYSGGYQTQVIAALTALGLIDSTGQLQQSMLDLVSADEAERKEGIGTLVRDRYAPILEIGTSSTQQMMVDAFAEMAPKVTGDTRRKAVAFFLAACNYAGITVSRHWHTPRVPPSGKPRKSALASELASEEDEIGEANDRTPAANVRELTLRSGGVVTLGLSVDLFSLTTEDRNFVFGLIDKMTEYENQRALPRAGANGITKDGAEDDL